MTVNQCHPNLYGITDEECNCAAIPVDKTYNVSTSTSGYFLTDFIDLKVATQDCDSASDTFDRMNKQTEKGQHDFSQLLKAEIEKRNTKNPAYLTYSGTMGLTSTFVVNTSQAWNGISWKVKNVLGGSALVKSVSIIVKSGEDDIRFLIKDSKGNTHFEKTDVNATVGNKASFDVNVRLPLYDEEDGELTYYFVHSAAGVQQTKADCGCGGEPAQRFKRYVEMNGTKTASSNAYENHTSTSSAGGVTIKSEMSCTNDYALCQMDEEQRKEYAKGVLYMAARNMAEWVMTRQDINVYTILDVSGLASVAQNGQIEAENSAKWLATNVLFDPCYVCGKKGYGTVKQLR